ncbi:DUF4231 domain-containing protein [Streptomyces sp. ODS28]|uniref:DUF4231 domain-containing protein n=1 Tax=Streptomyces sp. ODS28 TaxID=3136688 RepID=UPI0031E8FC8A
MIPGQNVPERPADSDPVLAYALSNLAWYARMRDRSRRWHRATELAALLTGSVTVVVAGLRAPAAVTAGVAGLTVFIGGVRQIFNRAERWVVAAEAWQRQRIAIERYRLVPEAERGEADRERLLAETEAVALSELEGWAADQRARGAGSPAP